MKQFDYRDGRFIVSFSVPKKLFQQCLDVVRSLKDRSFNYITHAWSALATRGNYIILTFNGFEPSPAVEELFAIPVEIPPTPMAPINEELLLPGLRPYQIEGLHFLEAVHGRGIIAFDMRLGKSCTALAWCQLHPRQKPVLIVCPANAKIGWQREIKAWCNIDALVLYGRKPSTISNATYVIVNYDILHDWLPAIQALQPRIFIVDECHYIATVGSMVKDTETGASVFVPVKRTSAFRRIADKTAHIIGLSGTPITKCPSQFEIVLRTICPDLFPKRKEFLNEYCGPRHNGWEWVYDGATNINKLRSLLALCMYRKRKEDVYKDLPQETKIIVPLAISDETLYKQEREEYDEWFREHTTASEEEIGRRLALLKSISYDAKRPQILEWIQDFIATDEPLVIFCWHRDVCEDIYKAFKDCSVLVYGGMTVAKRQEAIDKFQTDDKIKVFIGQYKACNTAISLSRASVVACVELPFTSGDLKQALERVFLPEDGKASITHYYLVAANTVDEDRADSLERQAKNISLIIDGVSNKAVFGKKMKRALRS